MASLGHNELTTGGGGGGGGGSTVLFWGKKDSQWSPFVKATLNGGLEKDVAAHDG